MSKDKEMTFFEHLNELRFRIIRAVIAVFVLSLLAFFNKEIIFDRIILAPKNADFITNRVMCYLSKKFDIEGLCIGNLSFKLINIDMSGQFMNHLYISLAGGVILATPYVLWEIWRFIKPALHEKELKYTRGFVFITTLLFVIGILFSYYIMVPLTINFLGTYQVSASVENQITLDSYISTVVSLSFALGLVFELPVLVFFLTKIGIISSRFLKKQRRWAIVIILIIAAIITPTTDIFTQLIVSIPLYVLFQVSIFVAAFVEKKK